MPFRTFRSRRCELKTISDAFCATDSQRMLCFWETLKHSFQLRMKGKHELKIGYYNKKCFKYQGCAQRAIDGLSRMGISAANPSSGHQTAWKISSLRIPEKNVWMGHTFHVHIYIWKQSVSLTSWVCARRRKFVLCVIVPSNSRWPMDWVDSIRVWRDMPKPGLQLYSCLYQSQAKIWRKVLRRRRFQDRTLHSRRPESTEDPRYENISFF